MIEVNKDQVQITGKTFHLELNKSELDCLTLNQQDLFVSFTHGIPDVFHLSDQDATALKSLGLKTETETDRSNTGEINIKTDEYDLWFDKEEAEVLNDTDVNLHHSMTNKITLKNVQKDIIKKLRLT